MRTLHADTMCPGCHGGRAVLVRRKWIVTALYECPTCGLRFRVPKDSDDRATFYDQEYAQGFTTALPDAEHLERLLTDGFVGHEKDYRRYLDVLAAIGVRPPARILDFGASWGYGSWQLQQAGYRVVAAEIGERRRRFAAERLGLDVIDDAARPPHRVDCFFSAHVMEHLGDPNRIWRAAQAALTPDGVFVAFVPNGDPGREALTPAYHRMWGQVHPLLITPRYLQVAAQQHGFECRLYSSPYRFDGVCASEDQRETLGDELAVVARRRSHGH